MSLCVQVMVWAVAALLALVAIAIAWWLIEDAVHAVRKWRKWK